VLFSFRAVLLRWGCHGGCVLWKCESGSGTSVDVPRSAKSDWMSVRSDVRGAKTAALYVNRRLCVLSELHATEKTCAPSACFASVHGEEFD
jgi:hypothetical protein